MFLGYICTHHQQGKTDVYKDIDKARTMALCANEPELFWATSLSVLGLDFEGSTLVFSFFTLIKSALQMNNPIIDADSDWL